MIQHHPSRSPLLSLTIAATCWLGFTAESALAQTDPPNPVLDIGVVQRFGSDAKDEMVIEPLSGDQLTVRLKAGNQEQVVITDKVEVKVVMEPLPEAQINERVVISTHRSFESAEDSANQWRSQGIEVELAQPQQWQVWARRDTYKTPLLRRLLLENLQANGSRTAFLDTQVQQQVPVPSLEINGYRYERDEAEITSANSRIRVDSSKDDSPRLYGGDLRLQTNAYGTYTLVNEVPLETYLRGVVPHEIGLAAPTNTIEAQAILARTYVLRNLRRFAIDDYQLCADTQCQVYWGLSGADPISDSAIANTRGEVLTYQNELVDALYSSTTGGVTAPFSDVWNGDDRPYLRAVVDSVQSIWDLSQFSLADEQNFRTFISRTQGFNEVGWDMFRWREENSLTEITSDMHDYLRSKQHPLANFTRIEELAVLERSPAGRVQKMAVRTDLGTIELEKDEILRALWAPNSTLFYVEPIYTDVASTPDNSTAAAKSPAGETEKMTEAQSAGEKTDPATPARPVPTKVLSGYAFVGGGYGHGVGMSQTGAYNLGELGWSSDRILSFYYPGTQVQPLSGSITFWRDPLAEE